MVRRLIAALSVALCVTLGMTGSAFAFGSAQPTPVGAVPSKATPNVLDYTHSDGSVGATVYAIAKVGNTVLLGGDFISVANPGSTTAVTDPDKGKYIVAFDASTGTVNTAFAPGLNGQVNALVPGPTPGTVFVGGQFSTVNGATVSNLVLLDVATGQRISTFRTSSMNGKIEALRLSGNRLFVGGSFTTFQGQPHGGLAAVNATTGVVDPFMQSTVAGHHNYVDGSTGMAQGAVGVVAMDITPDGTRMVVIGNFKTVDGLPRDQVAMFDLTGSQAVVRADWQTNRYGAACYYWAFDSWVRDVAFSPDGSYFAIVSTGGGATGSDSSPLCDSTARWETGASGTNLNPSWVDYTGRDSLFSVAITGSAVYVGGHPRWMNNPNGADNAQAGAVPRPGLAALDPQTGLPLSWNPGRNPRGVGVFAMLATPDGLYVGMDTDWIGNYTYRRMKVAYFPLAGGQPVASTATPQLPGAVYLGGTSGGGASSSGVLYRVNAAGPTLSAIDNGPNWTADDGSTSPYRNSGSNASSYGTIGRVDSTVPASTPPGIFSSERWDPGTKNDGGEMHWAFPVTAGKQVTVRLYFANQYAGTSQPGQRVFDVAIDNTTVLDHYDIVASAGNNVGTMRSFTVTSDGTVDITFTHEVENPLINGIEIVDPSVTPSPQTAGVLNARSYDGTTAGPATPVTSDLDWNKVRMPMLIGGTLFYGLTDGTFHSRSFDGQTFGPDQVVDPYNDPAWSTVLTGSKDNSVYRGVAPALFGQLGNVTSAFYSDGRIYYTLLGSSALNYQAFLPDSGILYPNVQQVPGVTLPQVTGAFLGGGSLYYVEASTGTLDKVAFTPGTIAAPGSISGTPAAVSGPGVDGVDWRSRTLFLGPNATAPANQNPAASFTASCSDLDCSFDATSSSDPDGDPLAFSWSFGDGGTGTGATVTHHFTGAGTFSVTLTVSDGRGGSSATSRSVDATAPAPANQPPTASFVPSCSSLDCSFDASGSTDPDGDPLTYSWSFGDGTTGTGATATHHYSGAGTFTVTLTVADGRGGSNTTTRSIDATSSTTAKMIAIRASAGASTPNGGTSISVPVPAGVQAGDGMVLILSNNSGSTTGVTGSAPSGFTQVGVQTALVTGKTNAAMTTQVFQKVADGSESGSSLTVPLSAGAKSTLQLVVYSGTAAGGPVRSMVGASDDGGTSHTTPDATANAGDWVLSVWSDKSSATRGWNAPSGEVVRSDLASTGTSGEIATLVSDAGQAVAATGTVAGLTATVPAASAKATMLSIVLAAGDAGPNVAPAASFAPSCSGLDCSFDATGSTDPDGDPLTYSWSFGDGTTGAGATATHHYATGATYTVGLTVSDGRGGSDTATKPVAVSGVAAQGIALRTAAEAATPHGGTSISVTVPTGVRAGDGMVLILSNNSGSTTGVTGSAPSGFTQVGAQAALVSGKTTAAMTTQVFQKVADGSESGSTLTVPLSAGAKSTLQLVVYSGTAAGGPVRSMVGASDDGGTSHTTPDATANAGDWVLSVWSDKSSDLRTWTPPTGEVVRSNIASTGTSGEIASLVADGGQPVTTGGPVSGLTATVPTASAKATMLTIVLAVS